MLSEIKASFILIMELLRKKNLARYYALKSILNEDKFLIYNNAGHYFSQAGEDIVLLHLFAGKKNGYYVDIGAHHPLRKSNTALFYIELKWNGINIDAQKESMKPFYVYRPRDINLEIGVNNTDSELEFYELGQESSAMNTFSKDNLNMLEITENKITSKYKIKTRRLDDILDEYLPSHQEIDFLSLDVEGFEINVLMSNNWSRFRPKVIAIEIIEKYLDDKFFKSDEVTFLINHGYKILFKLPLSYIFIDENIKLSKINQIIDN